MIWEKSKGDFIEADVVEWIEAIWSLNKYKKGKSKPWGRQKVVGQITKVEGDVLQLIVLRAIIIENVIGADLRPYKTGVSITKKRATLLKGSPERLHWSEEEVRAALLKAPVKTTAINPSSAS